MINPEGHIRDLEATVKRLQERLDRLEAAVLYLCDQDGAYTFDTNPMQKGND